MIGQVKCGTLHNAHRIRLGRVCRKEHIKIGGFSKDHKVKLFRVVSSTRRTEYVVTNDKTQNETSVAQQVCHWRWKIEQFHREAKQVTGLEMCQRRLSRVVRNHIECAFLVWIRLAQVAYHIVRTVELPRFGCCCRIPNTVLGATKHRTCRA